VLKEIFDYWFKGGVLREVAERFLSTAPLVPLFMLGAYVVLNFTWFVEKWVEPIKLMVLSLPKASPRPS